MRSDQLMLLHLDIIEVENTFEFTVVNPVTLAAVAEICGWTRSTGIVRHQLDNASDEARHFFGFQETCSNEICRLLLKIPSSEGPQLLELSV